MSSEAGWDRTPARAKSDASVSSSMGRSGSKTARTGAHVKDNLSFSKAATASGPKLNWTPFLRSLVMGETMAEKSLMKRR